MKKTKLFLSISGLCLALSVLVFGVFAATQVDYSISGQIIYEVTDAYIEADTKIYASEVPAGFSTTYDTAVALKSPVPNLSKLNLVEYDVSDIVDDFSFNSLTSAQSTCEFDNVALSGYYGYYFVITAKNLSQDVQVYVTADAVSDSDNVMVVSSGLVPSITPGGSKIVIALMVEDATTDIDTENYTLTMRAGSVVESDFTLVNDSTLGWTISQKTGITYSGPLVIPESVDGQAVECVGDFSGLTNVTEIYVPESITAFAAHCFEGCSSLATLTVPFIGSTSAAEDVQALVYFFATEDPEDDDFYSASQGRNMGSYNLGYLPYSLKTLTVTSAVKLRGGSGYSKFASTFGSAKIDNILITSNVLTELPTCSFQDSELKHVYISSSVEEIVSDCFGGCDNLTRVDIPSSVLSIGQNAFGSAFLDTLYRNGMAIATAYDDHTVRYLLATNTDDLPSKITREMLNGVVEIPDEAFSSSDITEAYIPASVKTIGSSAFSDCHDLTKVTIEGNGLQTIGVYAFSNCYNLKALSIPASVMIIDGMILAGCRSLESLTLPFIGKKNYSSISEMRAEECDGDTSDSSFDYCTTFAWYFETFGNSQYFVAVGGYQTYYVPKTLKYVEILEGCLNIFDGAFNDNYLACPITEIVIPSTFFSTIDESVVTTTFVKYVVSVAVRTTSFAFSLNTIYVFKTCEFVLLLLNVITDSPWPSAVTVKEPA